MELGVGELKVWHWEWGIQSEMLSGSFVVRHGEWRICSEAWGVAYL